MKKISLMIILLAASAGIYAKNMHPIFGTSEGLIKGCQKLEVFMVESIPVMSVEQMQGKEYICDYPVVSSSMVKKKDGKSLILAVLDTNQYMSGLIKKCPFMGKYAVRFTKGNQSLTLIISAEPCDKVIIFCPGSPIDKKHIDIKERSAIIAFIEPLFVVHFQAPKVEDEKK